MGDSKKMNRADFFKFGLKKGKEKAVNHLQKKVEKIGVRPPGAIDEEEFLIACTRCNDCAIACPHDSIFKPTYGAVGAYGDTPFLDLNDKACEYCEDLPCITACKTGALVKEEPYMKLGIAKFVEEHCLVNQGQYCDYCAKSCPKEFNALKLGDNKMPIIDEDACVGCGKCQYICVSQSGKAIVVIPS
ncbi:MAG: 4Fe-4S dicluster domain-containing protein [Reichenbachiella sp.]